MMLYQWRLGEEVTTIPTIGFNVETIDLPKGIKFTLWDVGGAFRPGHCWAARLNAAIERVKEP